MIHWRDNLLACVGYASSPFEIFELAFTVAAEARGYALTRVHRQGVCSDFAALVAAAPNGRTILVGGGRYDAGTAVACLEYPDGLLKLSVNSQGAAEVSGIGLPSWAEQVMTALAPLLPAARPGTVHVLTAEHDDAEAVGLPGALGAPFEPDNYSSAAADAFAHLTQDLIASDPCGRFILMHGPPGTGKTFFVRALVDAVGVRARFLLIPVSLVSKMGDPSGLPVLMREHAAAAGTPLVLVIEDADGAMLPRGADNAGEIAALLNLTDGIVGRALDLRFICTTNAARMEIDPALLRPGRLCRSVEFGTFGPAEAGRIARRLGQRLDDGDSRRDEPRWTLAELYALPKEDKPWRPRPIASLT